MKARVRAARPLAALLLAAALAAAAAPGALAQQEPGALAQQGPGALAQQETAPLRFGARADARPMSYLAEGGRFSGYVIDICEAVKRTYRELYGDREIAEGYVEVTAANRIDMLLSGKVDTVCGAFSVTEARLQDLDYSFLIFASGATVATRRPSSALMPAPSLEDQKAPRRVAVVAMTTTEEFIARLLGSSVKVSAKDSHTQAFAALAAGEVDYYFGDRVILNAVIAQADNADDFVVGGKFLTYEPYALPFVRGKNEKLRHAANLAIARLFRSGQIRTTFKAHFDPQTPSDLLLSLFDLYAIPE